MSLILVLARRSGERATAARRRPRRSAHRLASCVHTQAQRLRILSDVVANINMKHGDGALMSLGDKPLAV